MIVGNLINIIFWYFLDYKYVQQLELNNCKCSDIWQRKYIKYLSLGGAILSLLLSFIKNHYFIPIIIISLIYTLGNLLFSLT